MRDTDSDVRAAALNRRRPTSWSRTLPTRLIPKSVGRVQLATSAQQLDLYAVDLASIVPLGCRRTGTRNDAGDPGVGHRKERSAVCGPHGLDAWRNHKACGRYRPGRPAANRGTDRCTRQSCSCFMTSVKPCNLSKRVRSNRSDVALLRTAPSWLRQHAVRRCSDVTLLSAMAVSDDWYTRASDSLLQTLVTRFRYDVRTARALLERPLPHNVVHDLSQDPHTSVRAAIRSAGFGAVCRRGNGLRR